MIILGIETSCDETAAAVIKDGREILSNVIASSVEMHSKTGGIIPENAAREQLKSILPVINEAINKSQVTSHDLDAIAVTVGPGLIGSLLVGVETAKTLAWVWKKPLIPVNHLWGHIYANWLTPLILPNHPNTPNLPAIALVVSGGHTDLVIIKNHGEIEWLGGTRDDAAGECFDKCARLLGFGFPGGPEIAKAASLYKIENSKYKITLPHPLINENNFDFSFSGLKTAVLREVNKLKTEERLNEQTIFALAYELQEAITDVLISKTLKAAKHYNVADMLVCGGVAANSRLRDKFRLKIKNCKLKIDLCIPPPQLCTDNAAMIGAAAEYNYKPVPWQQVSTDPSLTITSL